MRRRSVLPVLAVVLFVAFLAAGCRAGGDPGTVKVVRNGGPFDNKKVKEVICPSQGRHYIGLNSTTHPYPASGVQRYYKITTDPGEGADLQGAIKAKSADGFNIHVSGTFEFQTVFDCEKDSAGRAALVAFDRQFGVRKFPDPLGGADKAPWQGERGWGAFLNAQFLPIIQNTFRRAMLQFTCEELVASCSLVASRGQAVKIDKAKAKQTGVNLSAVQDKIAATLAEELDDVFCGNEGPHEKGCGHYFTGVKFLMSQPELDDTIETAINASLAAFAAVSQAQAQVQQATQAAEAAKKLANVYKRSPSLVELEKWRIICGTKPGDNTTGHCSGLTIYAGLSPTPTTNAGK